MRRNLSLLDSFTKISDKNYTWLIVNFRRSNSSCRFRVWFWVYNFCVWSWFYEK